MKINQIQSHTLIVMCYCIVFESMHREGGGNSQLQRKHRKIITVFAKFADF